MKPPKSNMQQHVRLTLDVNPHVYDHAPLLEGSVTHTAEQVVATAKRHGITLNADNDIVQSLCSIPIPDALPQNAFILISEILGFINELDNNNDDA